MPQKKVCRLHGHVLAQCRCNCQDRKIPMDCTRSCPDYGKPPREEKREGS